MGKLVSSELNKSGLATNPPRIHIRRYNKEGEPIGYSRFYTKAELKDLRKLFYSKNAEGKMVKTLPSDMSLWLNDPLILALWIMGDGSRQENSTVRITVDGYSLLEIKELIRVLKLNFGIIGTLHSGGKSKSGNPQYKIYISAKSYPRLKSLVLPWFTKVPSMLYKLP